MSNNGQWLSITDRLKNKTPFFILSVHYLIMQIIFPSSPDEYIQDTSIHKYIFINYYIIMTSIAALWGMWISVMTCIYVENIFNKILYCLNSTFVVMGIYVVLSNQTCFNLPIRILFDLKMETSFMIIGIITCLSYFSHSLEIIYWRRAMCEYIKIKEQLDNITPEEQKKISPDNIV